MLGGEPGEDTEEFLELQEKLKNPEKMTRYVKNPRIKMRLISCKTRWYACSTSFVFLPRTSLKLLTFFAMSRKDVTDQDRWWREITFQVWASQVWHPAIGGEGRLLWHPGSCKVCSPLSFLFTLYSTFSAFQTPFSTWLESPAGTSWFPFGLSSAPPSLERLWSRCTFRWGIILIKSRAKFKLLPTFRKSSSS